MLELFETMFREKENEMADDGGTLKEVLSKFFDDGVTLKEVLSKLLDEGNSLEVEILKALLPEKPYRQVSIQSGVSLSTVRRFFNKDFISESNEDLIYDACLDIIEAKRAKIERRRSKIKRLAEENDRQIPQLGL